MRLRARLDELLKAHYKEVTLQFKSYQERPFYEKLEKLLGPYQEGHLPNAIDFELVYELIREKWDSVLESSIELIEQVHDLCLETSQTLFKKHFKRFPSLLELLLEKTKEEI